ncbi:MBOAT, membrane-bound O-acyltransferase family-domain-containing protein [Paraphoma chrysanthemicola]|uniref:O-acyltransferase n=1 Tax=Paraphoma chrysanthemicola TaxID=798071 RepID=A0A8K0QX41_9PLEO|nr:MBOAT, membrane-bound O-acyltransferase family-domain-containing protein [Paraphoma chrysanthemicola]
MATSTSTETNTSIATAIDMSEQSTLHRRKPSQPAANGNGTASTSKPRKDPKYRHVFATHSVQRTSCLDPDSEESPSFIGFRNLMILVLIVSNLRLMIVNIQKYGVLICISCHDYSRSDLITGLALYVLVPAHLFVTYLIELAAAWQAKRAFARITNEKDDDDPKKYAAALKSFNYTWYIVAAFHSVNATMNLYIATTTVYYDIHHPGIGTMCTLHAVIVFLKCASYALTNRDLRHAYLHPKQAEPLPELYNTCPYPQNINFNNLCYFWWAPTLVYQPVYPRTKNIRWGFVFKRLLELAGLSIVIWIASAQYAAPLLQNSLNKMITLNFTSIAERIMKLSTISVFCWLCGFFALFQSALNALAEVMRFGDREFYGDWWNVSSIRKYWTIWNKPVTNFMRRHIYSPLVGRGCPPALAQIIVFIFSGVLHELLVGVPTHNIIGVAFAGMMVQIPLIALTDIVQKSGLGSGKVAGNMIFWVSFCLVGQPLAALLYFFAWQAKYGSVSKQVQENPALQMFLRR